MVVTGPPRLNLTFLILLYPTFGTKTASYLWDSRLEDKQTFAAGSTKREVETTRYFGGIFHFWSELSFQLSLMSQVKPLKFPHRSNGDFFPPRKTPSLFARSCTYILSYAYVCVCMQCVDRVTIPCFVFCFCLESNLQWVWFTCISC